MTQIPFSYAYLVNLTKYTPVFIISSIPTGKNAVTVRNRNTKIPHFLGDALQFGTAAIILFVIALARNLPFPKERSLIGVIKFGVLQYGMSAKFFQWCLLEVSIGMFQIILALCLLNTFLLAIIHQQENFYWRTLVGGIISLADVGIIFQ